VFHNRRRDTMGMGGRAFRLCSPTRFSFMNIVKKSYIYIYRPNHDDIIQLPYIYFLSF